MEVQELALKDVVPYARNPRNNKASVDKVAASIKEFGFKQPIVVDSEMVIIAGHTRYLAAKKLKLKKVPVVIATDLTPIQVKAYRLADNRTHEESQWDEELLALELEELNRAEDFNIELTGFDKKELEQYLHIESGMEGEADTADDDEGNYKEQYGVIVVCDDEAMQEEIYTTLTAQGYNCKVVVT